MGKKGDLSDFERGMVVGARRLICVFKKLLIYRVYRDRSEKEKISSERQLCGRKFLVDVRGEWVDWLEMIERQQQLK